MTQDAHPTEEALAAYAEAEDRADQAEVTRHLVRCARCRNEVAGMRRAVEALRAGSLPGPARESGPPHLSDASIARYVDQRLEAPERAAAKAHLDACPACLKAALHYAGHATAMRAALGADLPVGEPQPGVETEVTPKPASRPATSMLDGIKRLLSLRLPLGIAVPMTVAATAILALAVWPGHEAAVGPGHPVASYQDLPVVTFVRPEGAPPGIGFFGQAGERTEPFDGLRGRVAKDGALGLSWAPVAGATGYSLSLYGIGTGDRREEIARVETSEPRARITATTEPGRRYEWRLSGVTGNGATFTATGGLVVASSDG